MTLGGRQGGSPGPQVLQKGFSEGRSSYLEVPLGVGSSCACVQGSYMQAHMCACLGAGATLP